MNKIRIISDGSCDLSQEEIEFLDVEVQPFYVSFKNEEYRKEIEEIGIREFYQQMVDNPSVFPKSSCPSPDDYFTMFEKHIKNGDSVICLCITKKFSGSINSAITAKQMCLEKYPQAKIEVVDTIVNTILQGLIVKETSRMRSDGLSFEQIIESIEKIKVTGRIFFTVKDLDYLRNGGRIGKLASLMGKILKISPLITLRDGEIFSSGIALGKKKALLKIVANLKLYLENTKEPLSNYRFAVGYGYSIEEGESFRQLLIEQLGINAGDITCNQIGAAISVHTGPYAIGIGVVKKYDK